MNKIVKCSVILCLILIPLSGCTEQQQTNIQGIQDRIRLTQDAGNYTVAESKVTLSIPQDAVDENVTITIEKKTTSPPLQNYAFIIGYEFLPEGYEFSKPISIQIIYDESSIPSMVNEEDLRLYEYKNNQLTEVTTSECSPANNYVRATFSHFCVYWVCSSTGSSGSSSGSGGNTSSGSNASHSAIYRFTTDTVEITEEHTYFPNEVNPESESYRIDAYFVWDPVTYVRFYEVTLNSTGLYPAKKCSLRWSEYQNGGYSSPLGWLLSEDREIYIYGDYNYYPGYGYFITTYTNLRGNFPTKHGMQVFHIWDVWDVSPSGIGYVDPATVQANIKAMKEAFYEWTTGWSATIRAVT